MKFGLEWLTVFIRRVGNTELWGKRFGLAISQLGSRVRGRGGSEAYAPHRVKLTGSGREVAFPPLTALQGGGAKLELYH